MNRLLKQVFQSIGLLLLGAASAAAQQDAAPLPAPYDQGVEVPTPRGHVYVETDGEGTPIIMVNGGPGAARTVFWGALDFLKDDGFQIVYFDETGVGRATREIDEPFSPTITVEDIETVRQHLGAEKIVVAGHSYGGVPALLYAITYPQHVEKLVMLSASADGASQQMNVDAALYLRKTFYPELWEELMAKREAGMISSEMEFLRAFYARKVGDRSDWRDPAKRQTLRKYRSRDPRDRTNLNVYFDIAGRDPEFEISGTLNDVVVEDALKDFTVPTLIVNGRFDWKTTPQMAWRFFKMLPEGVGRLEFLEQTGHWTWAEEPERFEAILTDFLTEAEASAP